MKKKFLIAGPLKGPNHDFVYWNRDTETWVSRTKATLFSSEESIEYPLPEGAMGWVDYNPFYKDYF
jgi:hypothetical protein